MLLLLVKNFLFTNAFNQYLLSSLPAPSMDMLGCKNKKVGEKVLV